jgi:hypothetical protein
MKIFLSIIIIFLCYQVKAQITTQSEDYKLDTLWTINEIDNIILVDYIVKSKETGLAYSLDANDNIIKFNLETGKVLQAFVKSDTSIKDALVYSSFKVTKDEKYIVSVRKGNNPYSYILVTDIAQNKVIKFLKVDIVGDIELIVHEINQIYIIHNYKDKVFPEKHLTEIVRYNYETNRTKVLNKIEAENRYTQSMITEDGIKFITHLSPPYPKTNELLIYNTSDDKLERTVSTPFNPFYTWKGIVQLNNDKFFCYNTKDSSNLNYYLKTNELKDKKFYTQVPTNLPYKGKWPIFGSPEKIQKIDENLLLVSNTYFYRVDSQFIGTQNLKQFWNLKTNTFLMEFYASYTYYDQETSIMYVLNPVPEGLRAIRITPKLTSTEPNHIENNGEKKFVLNYSIDDNTINVMLEDYTNIRNITLNNIQGIALYELNQFANNEIQFDITIYPKGTYFITVTTKDNQKEIIKIIL